MTFTPCEMTIATGMLPLAGGVSFAFSVGNSFHVVCSSVPRATRTAGGSAFRL